MMCQELSPLMSRPTMETDNEESNDVSTPTPVIDSDIATPVSVSSKKVMIFDSISICFLFSLFRFKQQNK